LCEQITRPLNQVDRQEYGGAGASDAARLGHRRKVSKNG
jgi:hypothetical protein